MKNYQREKLAGRAKALSLQGWSVKLIAEDLEASPATVRRLLASPDPGLTKHHHSGRKPGWQLTDPEIKHLKDKLWEKDSVRLAVEELIGTGHLADETEDRLVELLDIAAETREPVRWPTWLTRPLKMTAEEKALRQGPKAFQYLEPARRRGAYYIEHLEDGSELERPLFPNALWESDDESENTPFRWLDPVSGKELVGRQSLKTVDVYSAKIMGSTLIGRYGDAYNTIDQATHARMLVEQFGLPLVWRLERGRWENYFWDGLPMRTRWAHKPEDIDFRWGGICDIITILRAKKSREKGQVEGTFDHLQGLNAGTSLDQGRRIGHNEKAEKKLRAAKRGSAQSGLWHVPAIAIRAELSLASIERFNKEAKERRMFGGARLVPDEIYTNPVPGLRGEKIPGFPDCKRECPADEWWRFYPAKTSVTVRNGVVTAKWKDHYYSFEVSGRPDWDWIGILPHGWPVFLAFDPLRPELGAHVANARPATHPENVGRVPLGHCLFANAPAPQAAPQFRIGAVPKGAGDFEAKKEWRKAVRQAGRTTSVPGEVADTVATEDTASDGLGNVVRMARGGDGGSDQHEQASPVPTRKSKKNNGRGMKPVDKAALIAAEEDLI